MSRERWMLYGAYGYTGELIAREAARRGEALVLAGRSAEKLAPLASRLGLQHVAVGLDDEDALTETLLRCGVRLVLHAAGPFARTSAPMLRACLRAGVHYLDISGEVDVFEACFVVDAEARRAGIVVMPGVGFDVVPTDCAARLAAEKVDGPSQLSLGIAILGGASGGTLKTIIESIPKGVIVRRGGVLAPAPTGRGGARVRFADRERWAIPMTWGDLATAYRTTGAPDITIFMPAPRWVAWTLRTFHPLLARLLRRPRVRGAAEWLVGALVRGPSAKALARTRTQIWARAENPRGEGHEVWIEAAGSYPFTVDASLLAVERVLAGLPPGATTPALAFGAGFVREIPGTVCHDGALP